MSTFDSSFMNPGTFDPGLIDTAITDPTIDTTPLNDIINSFGPVDQTVTVTGTPPDPIPTIDTFSDPSTDISNLTQEAIANNNTIADNNVALATSDASGTSNPLADIFKHLLGFDGGAPGTGFSVGGGGSSGGGSKSQPSTKTLPKQPVQQSSLADNALLQALLQKNSSGNSQLTTLGIALIVIALVIFLAVMTHHEE